MTIVQYLEPVSIYEHTGGYSRVTIFLCKVVLLPLKIVITFPGSYPVKENHICSTYRKILLTKKKSSDFGIEPA